MKKMTSSENVTAAVLLLLVPWVSVQITQSATDSFPQLRCVTQLSVSGCTLTVHDTGASDGPHLEVEPIMCVTESLHNLTPRYDLVTQQLYVSVPVTLRDNAMLAEVQHQLRHLSPKSVNFVTVLDISVSIAASSQFQSVGFLWSPDESVGFLLIGCGSSSNNCNCSLASKLRTSNFEVLEQAVLSAKLVTNGTIRQFNYPLIVANESFTNPDFYTGCSPECKQLRLVRSISLNNCTARVHQSLIIKGYFFIEPLLCHNITSMGSESVRYDYSRDKYYLKLDVVLQDDMVLDAVRTHLADLSPRSVTFMRLWRVQNHVSPALSRLFEIGPLMVSGDGRSAQLRVYCKDQNECLGLRFSVTYSPIHFWLHVKYWLTSLVSNRCILKSDAPKHPWRVQESKKVWNFCYTAHHVPSNLWSKLSFTSDGRLFIKIQQRLTGTVSFQRTWAEYEEGFGDENDFWIGLKTIHSLTGRSPKLLRVEAVTWSDKLYVFENSGFSVGDASAAYKMTLASEYPLPDRTNRLSNWLILERNSKFSTFDKNYQCGDDCSNRKFGKGGWWYNGTFTVNNPNGIYQSSSVANLSNNMFWFGADRKKALKSIVIMLLLFP